MKERNGMQKKRMQSGKMQIKSNANIKINVKY